jgi:hypothetical protein
MTGKGEGRETRVGKKRRDKVTKETLGRGGR